jgi:transposase InsO family protein
MRRQGLRARPRRRGLPQDKGERDAGAMASNLLDRQFQAQAPNQKWVADFTLGSSPRAGSTSGRRRAGSTSPP